MGRANGNDKLLKYLEQIMEDPLQASLDREDLKEEHYKLADAMDRLCSYLLQNRSFVDDLTRGHIRKARLPDADNKLFGTLKPLYSMLSYMLNIMERISKGNYGQRMNIADDISQVFNTMISRLAGESYYSYHDRLTGVLNEAGFDVEAARILSRKQGSLSYFLVSINIDGFQQYSLLYGEQKSRELLKTGSRFLEKICGSDELCARLYTDHFFCLLKGNAIQEIMNRLCITDNPVRDTVTFRTWLFHFGIYRISKYDMDISVMRSYADFACQNIPNRLEKNYAVFDVIMEQKFSIETTIFQRFEQALAAHEFVVYYQPQVDMRDERVCGCEALVRWRMSGQRIMQPSHFIPLLERCGLIVPLDFFVFEQACCFLRKLFNHKLPGIPIAVNFSRVHMLDGNLIMRLNKILKAYHIDPKWIQIEITETAFFERQEELMQMIQRIRNAGFRIALDDFGSGYSSLNFLKNIPIDVLKIDQLFFEKFDDKKNQALVAGILAIAQQLQLETIAEGVEEEYMIDFLRDHDCDVVQGFWYYRPVRENSIIELLKRQS